MLNLTSDAILMSGKLFFHFQLSFFSSLLFPHQVVLVFLIINILGLFSTFSISIRSGIRSKRTSDVICHSNLVP